MTAGLSQRQIPKWDRTSQFALVAAQEVLADSGILGETDPARMGTMVGTSCGMTISLDREYAVVSDEGSASLVDQEHGVPYLYAYFLPSSMAAEIAWQADAEDDALDRQVRLRSTGLRRLRYLHYFQNLTTRVAHWGVT